MKVSVVICTYSGEMYEHFREAADSVLDQTHDDVELVVIVDGAPEVYDRVESDYGDRDDVTVSCNDENVGLLASRNRGTELATGEDLVDPFVGHALVEQVAVGADEDHARLAPAQGLVDPLVVEAHLAGEFRHALRVHAGQPGAAGVRLHPGRGETRGVAVCAALIDQRAAGDRVPRRVGPFYFRGVSHCAGLS